MIFAQRCFALGAAVEVIEDGLRESAHCQLTQIFNVDDPWRRDGARPLIHLPPNLPRNGVQPAYAFLNWTWREALYSTNSWFYHARYDFRLTLRRLATTLNSRFLKTNGSAAAGLFMTLTLLDWAVIAGYLLLTLL